MRQTISKSSLSKESKLRTSARRSTPCSKRLLQSEHPRSEAAGSPSRDSFQGLLLPLKKGRGHFCRRCALPPQPFVPLGEESLHLRQILNWPLRAGG